MTKEKLQEVLRSVEAQKKDEELYKTDSTHCCQRLMEYRREAKGFLLLMETCGHFSEAEIEEEKQLLSKVEEAIRFYGFRFD